jgi:hypothetical protein
MSFVCEKISEVDGEKMRWEQYPEYQNLWKAHPDVWAIDRELDVCFWRIKGRMPERPNEIFGVYWKGNGGGRVEAIETLKVSPEIDGKLCDAFWEVIYIRLPVALESERIFIANALKDALEAFSRRRNDVVDVQVSIR